MLKFDTYEELFTYKSEFINRIIDCVFIDKPLKISYNGKKISLFTDYEFYNQILQKITEILHITNKFSIFIEPLPNYYGITIEKREELIIGDVMISNSNNNKNFLLHNLPELNVLNISLGDGENLKYLTNPPPTLQEINIVHNINNYIKNIDDFKHLFNKIPFGCSVNLIKYNKN